MILRAKYFTIFIVTAICFLQISCGAKKQATAINDLKLEEKYKQTLIDRTSKILQPLQIVEKKIFDETQFLLVQQYVNINTEQEKFTNTKAAIKQQNLSKEQEKEKITVADDEKKLQLGHLQKKFITNLSKNLSTSQVEQIKDGMTYGVLPKTYKAFQEMIPNLTEAQKTKIYDWLIEARELAMTEGSSDAKHAMFGKYKGKINNYLSTEGYDLKKEGEAWALRIKQQKENSSNK